MITDTDYIFDITSRVKIHDIHQFEIKLEYNLEELRKTNNYKIETFLFIPKSLRINKNSYNKEKFYEDLKNYIRFKTPHYNFKLILDPEFVHSPFYSFRRILKYCENEKDPRKKSQEIRKGIKEIKLLGIMMRARFRDYRYLYKRKDKKLKPKFAIKRLDEIITLGNKILSEFREIRKDFMRICSGERDFFRYFKVTEEFLSCLIEEESIRLLKLVEKKLSDKDKVCLEDIKQKFKDFLKKEKQFRETSSFNLYFKDEERTKEQYIYHINQYKKIIASVLYLSVDREQKEDAYMHIVGSVAAFLASVISFFITLIISQKIAINTLPFILFISLGYVFKDRIKDIIKIIFNPRVLTFFPDHVTQIIDSQENNNLNLGDIREKIFFTKREKMDPIVLSIREKTRPAAFLPEEAPEDILVYQKEINIRTDAVRENHSRTLDIADIMRFNIHRYLQKMDDPEQMINYYDMKNNKIVTTCGEKTYHLNLVIKYSNFSEKKEQLRYERYRIVLSKWGIKRVEFVEET